MTTKTKSLAILNSTAPFSKTNGKDALDIALIFGSYEQPTSLFFQADGVWQLIDNQNPEAIKVKNYLKTFSALEFYDIENIYICRNSLKERKLAENFHIDNVQILNAEDFSEKLSQHQVILRF
ncbi:MAG: sulfurtransferase complex subunit TusC [Alteromonadaceae bacterium]|nr:sulfurtransferase complex subunit TusC [Alteromonadaceae bacterium]